MDRGGIWNFSLYLFTWRFGKGISNYIIRAREFDEGDRGYIGRGKRMSYR